MGLFGKKKDFWDEVDEASIGESEHQTLSEEEEADIQRELDEMASDKEYAGKGGCSYSFIYIGNCHACLRIYDIYIFQQRRYDVV